MFYLLGDLFQLLFTPYKIPYIGFIINWLMVAVGSGMLVYWSAKLFSMGANEDKPYTGI
jgi:hypothetical protein